MRYGSVCSGIEAATVAWHPLGWEPAFFSEIEPFPSAVLAHHYPEVKNYGDFTRLIDSNHPVHADRPIDLLVGGTPCQAFSVAGLRAGLADPRGGLTLEFLRLARALRPKWIVWENVPGVLSQDGGRAFGAFIGGLEDLGYGWAYRVVDAQYTRVDGYPGAVPQRRKRVFVVGHSGGDFSRAAAVLLEPEGMRRDHAPSRKSGQEAAADAAPRSTFWNGGDIAETLTRTSDDQRMPDKNRMRMVVQPVAQGEVAGPLDAHYYKGLGSRQGGEREYVAQAIAFAAPAIGTFSETQVAGTLMKHNGAGSGETQNCAYVAFDTYNHATSDVSQTIKSPAGGANESVGTVMQAMAVRRLTPVECERLQGFPDDYTRIPWKKKSAEECPDGGRYKALGNSMAVNVMRWIGRRIELVEASS
jgi:DNA (cytosine-5)-methyltransferase 1